MRTQKQLRKPIYTIGFIAICLLGLGLYMFNYSAKRTWQSKIDSILPEARRHHLMWSQSNVDENQEDILSVVASHSSDQLLEKVEAAHQTEVNIYRLWNITTHCLFQEVPPGLIVQDAETIFSRYDELRQKQGIKTDEKMALSGIEENIELLKTEYCWPALAVIQNHIWFETPISVAGELRQIDVDEMRRIELYNEMKTWFLNNKDNLYWDPALRKFTQMPRHRKTSPFSHPIRWDPFATLLPQKQEPSNG